MVEKKCDNCDNSLILEPNGPCETCDDDRCNWKPIGTDAVIVTFISEIAGSLAVIADVLAEQREGGTNERTD